MSTAFASYPQNVVSLSGHITKFYCESSCTDWKFRSVASLSFVRVAEDGFIVDGLDNKYSVATNGKNVLTVKNTSMTDAGTYKCTDVANAGKMKLVELIVLGKSIKSAINSEADEQHSVFIFSSLNLLRTTKP